MSQQKPLARRIAEAVAADIESTESLRCVVADDIEPVIAAELPTGAEQLKAEHENYRLALEQIRDLADPRTQSEIYAAAVVALMSEREALTVLGVLEGDET